jgi:hypothetical protein
MTCVVEKVGAGPMRSLIWLIIVSFMATSAAAGPATGSRLGDWRQKGPSLTARDQAVGAQQLAKCLYDQQTKMARALLLSRDPSRASLMASKLMGELRCANSQFANELVVERRAEFPTDILRGMLAEAALDHSRSDVKALQPLPLQPTYQRDWFAVTGRDVSVDEMAACVADTNPAAIASLLSAGPLSDGENGAFAGLSDSLGKCLRIGAKLTAGRQALREALADALFQRLNAPATEPVNPANLVGTAQ